MEGQQNDWPSSRLDSQPLSFCKILDEIPQSTQGDVPWYMLFADDIVLAYETREEINAKLDNGDKSGHTFRDKI